MATHFILDNKLKEERETLSEVLKLAERKPYPDEQTVHLARFVDSCFFVIEEVKRKELQEKEERLQKKRLLEEEKLRKQQELQRKKALEVEAPSPSSDLPPPMNPPELPALNINEIPTPLNNLPNLNEVPSPPKQLEKREYVLSLYNNPVGILVEKENDIYVYHVVEPNIDKYIIDTAKSMYGKDLEKNTSLFEDSSFIARLSEKIANRTKTTNSDILKQKLLYYLQRDILGAGVLDPLLYDEKVKNIYIDSPNKNIRVDYDNLGQMNTNIIILDNTIINRLLQRLAIVAGMKFDEKNPILDISFQGLKFESLIGQGGNNTKVTIRRFQI